MSRVIVFTPKGFDRNRLVRYGYCLRCDSRMTVPEVSEVSKPNCPVCKEPLKISKSVFTIDVPRVR